MKKIGFSLAEMMIVMLILTIVLAASTPIITKKSMVQTASTASSVGGVPIGTIIIWSVAKNPKTGTWLDCNGQSTAAYPELADIVGANVPNYSGMFLRGQGEQTYSQTNGSRNGVTATTHTAGDLGVIQGDAIRNMTGAFGQQYGGYTGTGVFNRTTLQYSGVGLQGGGDVTYYNGFDASRMVPVATENRPINIAVRYLIKAKD